MLLAGDFRNLLESDACGGDPRRLGRTLSHLLGATDARGRHYHHPITGERQLRAPGKDTPRIPWQEVSLRGLAESLWGDQWERHVRRIPAYLANRDLIESDPTWQRSLLEDTGAGTVSASAFGDINAFTAATAGLMDAMILEAYQNPDFIGDVLAPVEPTKQLEGRKTIGVTRVGDKAEERLPLMPTARVKVGERWLTQPRTVENALAAEVDYLAIYLDLTGGQLADHTGGAGLGEWLGWRREIRIIDSFIGCGQVSTAKGYGVYVYTYNGTTYNPYITAGYYDNFISTGNELLHEDAVQAVMIKFRDMTDPYTGTRIQVRPNTVLVNREKARTAEAIFGSTAQTFQYRDAPGSTTNPQLINVSQPFYKGQFRLLESALVYQRMTDPDGLNLSASAAAKAWFAFESGAKTHVYAQNWPMRIRTAAPNQVDMIDRDVVMFTKADERGIPFWKEPRRVVQSRA